MIEQEIIVRNESGIHARPASMIVKRAKTFESEILILHKENTINAKVIFNVLLIAAEKGDALLIRADGPDEQAALDAMVHLFLYEIE